MEHLEKITYKHVVGLGLALIVASISAEGMLGIKVEVGSRNAVMWVGVVITALGTLSGLFRVWIDYRRESLAVTLKQTNIKAGRPDADKTMIRDLMGGDDE